MGSIVVCGGGVVGLSTALMLARDGHRVTVLEGDPQPPPPPDEAWSSWSRRGVAQFHQPHTVFSRFRIVCDAELPELPGRMLDAGCVAVDPMRALPPTITDRRPRPGDEDMRAVTGRRPVAEAVLAGMADETDGVRVRRGEAVKGLVGGPRPGSAPGSVPHVTGVRTAAGEEVRADVVVDATGRRGPAARWLAALDAPPVEVHAEDRGFVYYTRFYRGPQPPPRIGPPLAPLGSISLITLYGDRDTWSVTIFGLAGDRVLRAVRDPAVFERVVAACPWQAPWLAGTPITDVLAMGGGLDRRRRLVRGDRPVVTGLLPVGDAWGCTNPSAGRGMSLGIVGAQQLRHAVREHLGDPVALASAYDERAERVVGPLFDTQIATDRVRVAEMHAEAVGDPVGVSDAPTARLGAAMATDPDAFRGFLEIVQCLATPGEVLARPAVRAAVDALGPVPPPRVPGPDRAGLLELVGDAPALPVPRPPERVEVAS